MRRWWTESVAAAAQVADRPRLWIPGALAWTVTVGWAALVIGVARPPGVAELTFLGAGIFGSGAWPWNAVGIGIGTLLAALLAFGLASAGEALLQRGRQAERAELARMFVIGIVCAIPALVAILALAMATVIVAPLEFNAPDRELGPLARTAGRLSPLLVAIVVAASAGAALHAAATRHLAAGTRAADALRRSPRTLAAAGVTAVAQAAAVLVARLAYLAICAALLRVLWAPIGSRLDGGGMDPAVALLLVGFVSIWLCLVLGGGALHAWGSVSWTQVLGTHLRDRPRSRERMETSTGP